MKTKLFFLITISLLVTNVFGQNKTQYLINKIDHFKEFKKNLNKNQLNNLERLDSILYKNYNSNSQGYTLAQQFNYLYDNNDNHITQNNYYWDTNNSTLVLYSNVNYTYTSNNYVASKTSSYDNNGVITPYEKKEYIYNNSNPSQVDIMIKYNYDTSNNTWVYNEKEIYQYASGLVSLVLTQVWDTTSNAWNNGIKGTITYDSNQNITEILIEEWSLGNWANNMVISRSFDNNNRISSELTKSWDGSNWVNNKQKTYTYTTSGSNSQVNYLNESWDSLNNAWTNQLKEQVDLNANNDIIFREYYQWDPNQNIWIGYGRAFYTYNNNIIEKENYAWDQSINSWKSYATHKTIYTYDLGFSYNDLLLPNAFLQYDVTDAFFPDFLPVFNLFRNKLTDRTFFYRALATDPWQANNKVTFKYSSNTSGVNELSTINAKVYPNPFLNNITIDSEEENFEVFIFDITGKKVYQKKHTPGEIIPLGFLNKGIYLYKIKAEDHIKTGKILKK
jgi:hypothetical protein